MTPTGIVPSGRNVLIQPLPRRDTTDSGIILEQNTTSDGCEGVVVATGKDVTEVTPGMTVLYSLLDYQEFPGLVDGHLIDERDIWAIFP